MRELATQVSGEILHNTEKRERAKTPSISLVDLFKDHGESQHGWNGMILVESCEKYGWRGSESI